MLSVRGLTRPGLQPLAFVPVADGQRIYLNKPGRYRVVFPAVAQRVTPAAREVDVSRGEIVRILGDYTVER